MRRCLLMITLFVMNCPSAIAQSFGMDNFLWKNRPLLVFAPSADATQDLGRGIAQAEEDFRERDMVLIEIYRDDAAALDGKRLPESTARGLRERYQVAEGEITVILVGKDGGEKLRSRGIPDLEQIFCLIDGMPMRLREMQ